MKAENQKTARLLADLSRNIVTISRKKKAEKAARSGKAGMTVKQILGNTPSDVKDRAKAVKINKSASGLSRKGNAQIIFDTESHTPTTKRRPAKHRTIIRLLNRQYRKLWVSCSCEYWKFYCEYAMAQFRATDIIHGNGEPRLLPTLEIGPMAASISSECLDARVLWTGWSSWIKSLRIFSINFRYISYV